jgi:hypothetical protein
MINGVARRVQNLELDDGARRQHTCDGHGLERVPCAHIAAAEFMGRLVEKEQHDR